MTDTDHITEALQDEYRSLYKRGFDSERYVARHPDVNVSGMAPVEHYVKIGKAIGRSPPVCEHLAANWERWARGIDPKVSVVCITYNHREFIEQAIEGLLMQEVDFPVEFLIADDCSTDGTQDVIRAYAARDTRIVPILRQSNLGVARNFADVVSRVRSPYLAMCEGDDYWTNAKKLAVQSSALDNNLDVSLVFHPVHVMDEETGSILHDFPKSCRARPHIWELVKGNFIQTNSVMYRWRFTREHPNWMGEDLKPLDWMLHLSHAQVGGMHFIDEVMAVYRKHSGGMWATASRIRRHRRKHGLGELHFLQQSSKMLGTMLAERLELAGNAIADEIIEDAVCTGDHHDLQHVLALDYGSLDIVCLGRGVASQSNSTDSSSRTRTASALKVSVVVVTYNHGRFLENCLDSVLSQVGPIELEVIVSDDCSTDDTAEIAETFARLHPNEVKVKRNSVNQGLLKNLRSAISYCTGDFIAFCEGDDYWVSDRKLIRQLLFLAKRPDFAMCFNWVLLEMDNGSIAPHPRQGLIAGDEVALSTLASDPLTANFSCCVYRAKVLEAIPPEYYETPEAADWLFNIYVGQSGRVGFLRETASVYRLHDGGLWSGMSVESQERKFAEAREVCSKRFGPARGFDDFALRFAITPSSDVGFSEQFHAHLDQPIAGVDTYVERGGVRCSGWVVSKTRQHATLVGRQGERTFRVEPRTVRDDVADHLSGYSGLFCSIVCGFSFDLSLDEGMVILELAVEAGGAIYPWCTVKGSLQRRALEVA